LLLVSPAVFLAVTIMMLNVLAGGLRVTLSPAATGR
jgi:ABC-type dipeptide/oligopeptide/nickel transport system permease subunit